MYARVTEVYVPPEQVDTTIDWWKAQVADTRSQGEGLQRTYLLLDRDAGRIQTVELWSSLDGLGSSSLGQEMLQQGAEMVGAATPEVHIYEVADEQ